MNTVADSNSPLNTAFVMDESEIALPVPLGLIPQEVEVQSLVPPTIPPPPFFLLEHRTFRCNQDLTLQKIIDALVADSVEIDHNSDFDKWRLDCVKYDDVRYCAFECKAWNDNGVYKIELMRSQSHGDHWILSDCRKHLQNALGVPAPVGHVQVMSFLMSLPEPELDIDCLKNLIQRYIQVFSP